MKKILSVVLAIGMAMSMLCSVSAETALPENIATDYVAGDVTGNLMLDTVDFTSSTDTLLRGTWFPDSTSSSVYPSNVASWQGKYLWVWADQPVTEANAYVANGQGVGGASINSSLFDFSQIQAGDGVVIMADVTQNRGTPYVKTALYQYNKLPIYPVEYPEINDDALVLDDTSVHKLVTTLPVPEEGSWSGINNTIFYIGFAPTTIEEEGDRRFLVTLDSFYMGIEYAYDMTITAEDKELSLGKPIVVNAEVVNQGNSTGTLDQSVTWYATNTDRTEVVNGFTFTEGEEGVYTVSVDSTVAAGTYDIVAVADENAEIVKGIEVTVAEAPSFEDYTPDEETRYSNNMVTVGTSGAVGASWLGDFTYGYNGNGSLLYGNQSGNYYYFKPTADVEDPLATSYHNPVAGFNIKTTPPENASGRVVYSLTMKDGISPAAVIGIGRRNTTYTSDQNPLRVEYPIVGEETDEFVLTAGYKEYVGTFADTGATPDKYGYAFGFLEGTKAQATVRFDTTATYIGYEYAYDMTVEASDTNLYPGKEITVSADIVNQIGKKFGGNTNYTLTAMDANRENIVNGFTFTEKEDGTYTVAVSEDVANGTYDLVAISSENDKIIKGVEVTVSKNPYVDHVADEETRYSNNMVTVGTSGAIGASWSGDFTYGYNGCGSLSYGNQSGNYYYFKPTADVEDPLATSYHNPVAGFNIKTTPPESASGRVVYSLTMKDGISPAAVVGIGRRNATYTSDQNPLRVEYPIVGEETDEFVLTTGYKEYVGTFADTGATPDKYIYVFGFLEGTKAQATVRFDTTATYIGYEYAYDMTVETSADTVAAGGNLTATASVINQIGKTYGGNEAINWYAMDTGRTSFIEGININVGENDAVSVSVGGNVPAGTYDIVAVLGDGVMAKGATITVTEPTAIEGVTLTQNDGLVTVATDEALTDAKLIFASYDASGKLVDLEAVTVTLGAQQTGDYAPADLTAGNYTKAMLWYNLTACVPVTSAIQY